MPKNHYLREAFYDGLRVLDTDEILQAIAEHVTIKGVWETGVISPSLVANQCRLARLKTFLGDDPQPGMKRMAVRAGQPDAVTNLNFIRGFTMEGMIVKALITALGQNRLMGNAPTLLFRWRYQGDDALLSLWHNQGMVFSGHPDVMVWSEQGELELVQIKTPSIYKLERVERMKDEEALKTYRAQMATEMYIGRRIGWPIQRSHLLLASWEATPKIDDPHCRVVSLEWDESLATIPEQIAREIIQDYDAAYTLNRWPAAYPPHRADTFPCSYCKFARLGGFDTIGCEEQGEWERFAETGETRLTVPLPDPQNPQIIPIRKRRQRRSA